MRKARDINAELKVLADKAKGLKAQRVMQLGDLVTVTGADTLDLETLAGALLGAVDGVKTTETKEAWRREGAAFFLSRRRKSAVVREDAATADTERAGENGSADPAG